MLIALTRAVPPAITRCQLTHVARHPIDYSLAAEQHRRYEQALEELGCTIQRLPPEPDLPDSVFVEDTAVVLRDLALIARPGAEGRRAETATVAEALRWHRPLTFIEAPGTLDGGDVLCIGTQFFVGRSERTNEAAIRQVEALLSPRGYDVQPVAVAGCLHLKTAVTQVGDRTVLLNPRWVDPEVFADFDRIEVHPNEPFAANALRIGDTVLYPSAHQKTRAHLEAQHLVVQTVDASELAKAEGGLTCCSLLVTV